MRPHWPKLASLSQNSCTLNSFQCFGVMLPKDNPFIEHFVLKKVLTYFVMLTIPQALLCVDSCICVYYLF